MAKIYVITNKINNKQYVGKTKLSIEERFKIHIRDSKKERCKNRPLYRAMNKYGPKNFEVSLIEETNNPEEREKHWINKLGTYGHNGYNATKGGDGKSYLNHTKIIKMYLKVQNIHKTAEIYGCHYDSVANILRDNNIEIKSSQDIAKDLLSKKVFQYTKDGELIKIFESTMDAARQLNKVGGNAHISECARGERKTAYGFIWRYEEEQK